MQSRAQGYSLNGYGTTRKRVAQQHSWQWYVHTIYIQRGPNISGDLGRCMAVNSGHQYDSQRISAGHNSLVIDF